MDNIEIGYSITTDPTYLNKENAITPELSDKLEQFHQLAVGGKKSSIQKILDAIEKYPDNPQLKNFLSVLYKQLNETQKMYDVNKWIIAEHPNYLFGKLNLANEYYLKQEYDKMPEVLGDEMEIKALYPDRDTFHLNEVTSFLKCAVCYFTAIGDLEQAEIRHDLMHKLSPFSSDTAIAMQQIVIAKMEAGKIRFEEEQKNRISVVTKKQEITNIKKAPSFYHHEMEWLYCNDLSIPEEKLRSILSLPKGTLIQDLEMVLDDSIVRFSYFQKLVHEKGWEEEKMNFVFHSLFLLGELKATKSIDAIFNVLSQSEEYLELYLGDALTALMWEVLYKIASNNLEVCKQFMYRPGIETYARVVLPDMIEQIVWHQPERRDEAISWYKDVLQFFLTSTLEENVIDSDVIALLICNLIQIKGKELLPEIEKLFNLEIVSKSICGDWDAVSKDVLQADDYSTKKEILTITERYNEITSTCTGFNGELSHLEYDDEDYFEPYNMPVRAEPKVGRNEPCPCGSGKKYKKCCLNK